MTSHRLLAACFAAMAVILCMVPCRPARAQMDADFYNGGAIRVGPSTTLCNGSAAGGIRFNATDKAIEFCDGGGSWKAMITPSSIGISSSPTPADGYFVVTSGSWDGNLQAAAGISGGYGYAAANKLCYDDLSANDWMGKTDAVNRGILIPANVEAFLCAGNGAGSVVPCMNPRANVSYYFAVSGSPAQGGAHFTADGSGSGPGNMQNWAGTNYFNGSKTFWSSRSGSSDISWRTNSSWGTSCGTQTWGTTAGIARVGSTNNTNQARWNHIDTPCSTAHRLICLVHP